MTVSELIAKLQEYMHDYGDVPVRLENEGYMATVQSIWKCELPEVGGHSEVSIVVSGDLE